MFPTANLRELYQSIPWDLSFNDLLSGDNVENQISDLVNAPPAVQQEPKNHRTPGFAELAMPLSEGFAAINDQTHTPGTSSLPPLVGLQTARVPFLAHS